VAAGGAQAADAPGVDDFDLTRRHEDQVFRWRTVGLQPGGLAVVDDANADRPRAVLDAADLRGHVLIHWYWPPFVPNAPTWDRWLSAARRKWRDVPTASEMDHLNFREELHAIDAVLAGQGIGICSDLLVSKELRSGELVKAFDLALPGYGFYLVHLRDHPRHRAIDALVTWLRSAT
jgi:DNA-binding transcriptional LysR family regulator